MPHAPILPRPLDSLDRLRARTKMMVEDYDTTNAMPTKPTYRTQLSIADTVGTPTSNATIRLWASQPMTVTVGGQSFSLPTTAKTAPAFSTNALGLLSVTYSPDDLTSPFLYASTDFVSQFGTTPDYEVLNTLSTLQGDDLAPDRATDYTGKPILLEKYQGQQDRDALASAIRNTIGRSGPNNQMFSTFLAGGALPELTSGTTRGVSPNAVLNWTLNLGDNAEFVPSSTEVFTAALVETEAALSFLGGLGDFVRDVVKGVKKVVKTVARWAKDSVDFIVHTAEGFYQFTVTTLEDAVKMVRGIFKSIVAAVEQVIQWLSYLFDWEDILRTQDALVQLVRSTVQALKGKVDTQLADGAMAVRGFFQAREADVGKLLAGVRSENPDSFASASRGAPTENPFAGGGQDSSVQTHWLMDRGMEGSSPMPEAIAAAQGDLLDRVSGFMQTAQTMVAANPDTQGFADQFRTTLDDFGRLVKGFSNFSSVSLDELLKPFADIALLAMKAAEVVAEEFLKLLQDVIDAVLDGLTQPLPTKVPFISDLYKALTGQDLSILGLGALLVAVPTTIVYKAVFGRSPVPRNAAPLAAMTVPEWAQVALSFTLLIRGFTDTANDALTTPSPFVGSLNLGAGAVLWGTKAVVAASGTFPGDLKLEDEIVLLVTLFPILVGAAVLYAPPGARAAFNQGPGPFILTGYGAFMVIVHSLLAGLVGGKYAVGLPANVTGDVPFAAKALVLVQIDGVPLGRLVVLAVDFTAYLLSAVLIRLQWATGGSSLLVTAA